jgi:hypothetical protein
MGMKALIFLTGTFLVAGLTGCVTTPTRTEGQTVSAGAVGDRGRVAFDEVVVSLRFSGPPHAYHNLHVATAAVVNPVRTTLANQYDVHGILQRVETRVAARLTEVLSGVGEQTIDKTRSLRPLILKEAQEIVDDAMRRWQFGNDFKVEVVITSLYWTDPSVGKPAASGGRGWW